MSEQDRSPADEDSADEALDRVSDHGDDGDGADEPPSDPKPAPKAPTAKKKKKQKKPAPTAAKKDAPHEPAKRKFFHKWMLGALLVSVATGIPAGLWYQSHDAQWQRRPPKLSACFVPLRARLEKPSIVSPSEPFPGPDGQTYYLTADQFRAVGCTSKFPSASAFKLAAAYATPDPEAQAKALSATVSAAPAGPDGDLEALSLWWLVKPSLQSLPESPIRESAIAEVDELVGCRFGEHPKLPGCSTRPAFPVGILVLGGVSAFALCLILASLLQSILGGRPEPAPAQKKS